MDGITLVRELRGLPNYRLVPLLVLTTESSPEKKVEGKQAGATGWLVKPFNPEQLLATQEESAGPRAGLPMRERRYRSVRATTATAFEPRARNAAALRSTNEAFGA